MEKPRLFPYHHEYIYLKKKIKKNKKKTALGIKPEVIQFRFLKLKKFLNKES